MKMLDRFHALEKAPSQLQETGSQIAGLLTYVLTGVVLLLTMTFALLMRGVR